MLSSELVVSGCTNEDCQIEAVEVVNRRLNSRLINQCIEFINRFLLRTDTVAGKR